MGRNPAALILTEKITALVVRLSTRFLDLNSTLTAGEPHLERTMASPLNVSLELNYRLTAHAVKPFCFVLL